MAALEESPATVAEGHTVSEMQACMTLSRAAQNCGLGWPKLFQLLPSFSPCTLNIRPVAKTPVSQFCSQGAITKMVEEVGRSYPCPGGEKLPLPCCPCAPAMGAPLLPFPQALRLRGAKKSFSLPSIYKEKLALSSGRVEDGFLCLRREEKAY